MLDEVRATLNSKKGFYVGDICYVLDDEIYYGIWGEKHGYNDGVYDTPYGKFAVASTAYGDGSYCDENGHEYGVDAGVIGIVPWEILEKQNKWKDYYEGASEMENLNKLGQFFEGHSADFYGSSRGNTSEDGLFEISIDDKTEICIHTCEDDYDEEDYDYSEEDYDPYEEDDYDED